MSKFVPSLRSMRAPISISDSETAIPKRTSSAAGNHPTDLRTALRVSSRLMASLVTGGRSFQSNGRMFSPRPRAMAALVEQGGSRHARVIGHRDCFPNRVHPPRRLAPNLQAYVAAFVPDA